MYQMHDTAVHDSSAFRPIVYRCTGIAQRRTTQKCTPPDMAMTADNHLQGSGVEAAISSDGIPVIGRRLDGTVSLNQSLM